MEQNNKVKEVFDPSFLLQTSSTKKNNEENNIYNSSLL